MKDDFHLVDLISQADAIKRLLEGKSAKEKLAWLSSHGTITQMEKKNPEWPETYFFTSAAGRECSFILQGDICRFVGDNHLSNIEF